MRGSLPKMAVRAERKRKWSGRRGARRDGAVRTRSWRSWDLVCCVVSGEVERGREAAGHWGLRGVAGLSRDAGILGGVHSSASLGGCQ